MDSDHAPDSGLRRNRRLTTERLILLLLEFWQLVNNLLLLTLDEHDDDLVITTCRLLSVEIESINSIRTRPLRVLDYVDRIVPGQTRIQFQNNFRVTPDIFEIILREFGSQIMSVNKCSPVTKLMDPRKQLLAVLWLLATPDSYRSVAERFDMGKSSLHKSFKVVVKVLCKNSNKIIKWPQGREHATAQKFKKFAGIDGIIGAIDGSYIPIKAPEEYPERYVNRKCYHAITVQAICDAELMFTDIYAGYPSSVSDRRIFQNSDIYRNVLNGTTNIPPNFFIIGDKAYPVLSWCIPPFIERQRLTNEEKLFNTSSAKTRQCIERAFALLKGRFRRLKYLDMSLTNFIPSVILACSVLHNICLFNGKNNTIIEMYINEGTPSVEGEGDNDYVHEGEVNGINIRRCIMTQLASRIREQNE